jgi:hypothetical protein
VGQSKIEKRVRDHLLARGNMVSIDRIMVERNWYSTLSSMLLLCPELITIVTVFSLD